MAAWMLPTAMLGSTLLASLTNRNSQTGQQEALTATQAKVAELMARQLQSNIGMQNTVLPDLLKGIQARIAQTQNRGRAQMWAPGIFTPRLKKRDPINYGTSGVYTPVDVGEAGLGITRDATMPPTPNLPGVETLPVEWQAQARANPTQFMMIGGKLYQQSPGDGGWELAFDPTANTGGNSGGNTDGNSGNTGGNNQTTVIPAVWQAQIASGRYRQVGNTVVDLEGNQVWP